MSNNVSNNVVKSVSQSRNASIASSETSETMSISDEAGANSQSGPRNVKLIKKQPKADKEPERPPWRATASPAQAKVDRSNLLKAKLLDASRRIARAAKNPCVATQTQEKTTLMKEVGVEAQKDLIKMIDEECLTDGVATLKDKPGTLIITHSVAQLTDAIVYRDTGTQTRSPRNALSFGRHINKMRTQSSSTSPPPDANYTLIRQNDKILKQQIDELTQIDQELNASTRKTVENGCTTAMQTIQSTPNLLKGIDENSDDIETDSMSDTERAPNKLKSPTLPKSKLLAPSHRNSWNDIEFSSDEDNFPELPRRVLSEGANPWCDFKDMILGQRLAKMRLSPIPQRQRRPNLKTVSWDDAQHRIVSNLVSEANALMDMFDKVTLLLGPDLRINPLPKIDNTPMPPFQLDSRLKSSCDALEEKIMKLKPIKLIETTGPETDLSRYSCDFMESPDGSDSVQ